MAKVDLSKLDPKERQQLDALLAKTGTSAAALSGGHPFSEQSYRRKCKELRSRFEKAAREEGATLEHVIAVSGKIYQNPDTKEVYVKGKKPKWFEEKFLVHD